MLDMIYWKRVRMDERLCPAAGAGEGGRPCEEGPVPGRPGGHEGAPAFAPYSDEKWCIMLKTIYRKMLQCHATSFG